MSTGRPHHPWRHLVSREQKPLRTLHHPLLARHRLHQQNSLLGLGHTTTNRSIAAEAASSGWTPLEQAITQLSNLSPGRPSLTAATLPLLRAHMSSARHVPCLTWGPWPRKTFPSPVPTTRCSIPQGLPCTLLMVRSPSQRGQRCRICWRLWRCAWINNWNLAAVSASALHSCCSRLQLEICPSISIGPRQQQRWPWLNHE